MELKKNKSALAALATLGVTAVAAGATAFVKMREKRRQQKESAQQTAEHSQLTAEQLMVYNEAVSQFLRLNDRIYELRRHRQELQPLIRRLTLAGERPDTADTGDIHALAADIERFLATQVPFINACLSSIEADTQVYADCVHGPVGGHYDAQLDEEPTGADVSDGAPITAVLRLGYYFPDSTIAPHPVKSVVLV